MLYDKSTFTVFEAYGFLLCLCCNSLFSNGHLYLGILMNNNYWIKILIFCVSKAVLHCEWTVCIRNRLTMMMFLQMVGDNSFSDAVCWGLTDVTRVWPRRAVAPEKPASRKAGTDYICCEYFKTKIYCK